MAKRGYGNRKRNLTIHYFGKKSKNNIARTWKVLPKEEIHVYVDSCTGSGSVMVNLFSGWTGAKKTAIDKDSGIIAMHLGSKEYPNEVIDAVERIQYDRGYYDNCERLLEEYSEEYERHGDVGKNMVVEAAAAELAMLYMSRNGMAKVYQPFMKKEKMDRLEDAERELAAMRASIKMHKKIRDVVINLHFKLRDVNLVCGDFMDDAYIRYWEDEGTFNYLDVPYMYRKRSITDRKGNTGYGNDWDDKEHERFLDTIEKMYSEGRLRGKLMICSNFEIDDGGELKGLQDDLYNCRLLKMGFRLVVTELTFSCEAHTGEDGIRKKTRKAEVVWINYTDIVGSWGELRYYDFQDVYGSSMVSYADAAIAG